MTKPTNCRPFKNRIDYVRLHCNLGSVVSSDNGRTLHSRLDRLTAAAKECQTLGMVPLILIQVPWREPPPPSPGEESSSSSSLDRFEQAVRKLAIGLKRKGVESDKVLLETRPPIGVSVRDETAMSGGERISLGLRTGRKMFEILQEAFGNNNNNNNGATRIAGFCVAGGSTKGAVPTAMQDDTQNAVRQGIRRSGLAAWGYEVCFWEMGAKLMLQPGVGRMWGQKEGHREAARELFRSNARALADEIILSDIP